MKNGGDLIDAPKQFQNDREIVLEAIKSGGTLLKNITEELQNDKEIVLQAVKQHPNSLENTSKELHNDREFIFEIIEQVEEPQLILTNNNENIISEAIDKFGTRAISKNISDKLPKYLCLKLVKIDGLFLKHLSDEMKSDIEIVEEAINQNPFSIFYSTLESEKDKKKMISKVTDKRNEKYPTSSHNLASYFFMNNLKDKKLAFKLVKYNPLMIHNLPKYTNDQSNNENNRKSIFKATLLENGYWMKFTENHFQERIIHKYYGAKIENNENEINYYKNRNNGKLLWSNDYKWSTL